MYKYSHSWSFEADGAIAPPDAADSPVARVKLKRVPIASVDSTQTLPLCNSTKALIILNLKPSLATC